jgi:hypothetical protein
MQKIFNLNSVVLQAKGDASRYATIAKDKHARWQMDSALAPQRLG